MATSPSSASSCPHDGGQILLGRPVIGEYRPSDDRRGGGEVMRIVSFGPALLRAATGRLIASTVNRVGQPQVGNR